MSSTDVSMTKSANDTSSSSLMTSLESFTIRHQSHHRPIAIVTSGGTTAHLEQNSVRFLDNFSTGQRGAASVECLLQRGYAVIHLWRRGSASPYARVISRKLGLKLPNVALDYNALDSLFNDVDTKINNQSSFSQNNIMRQQEQIEKKHQNIASETCLSLHPSLSVDEEIREILRERSNVQRNGLLLTVPFESVEQYLDLLQKCCESTRSYNGMVMIYLAAAVSDFWIPPELRSEHKMESSLSSTASNSVSQDVLTLKLYPVPKVIGKLREQWAPNAFCVSFKLETNEKILEKKMRRAVERYKVHMVIGNMLHTRHNKVHILHSQYKQTGLDKIKDPANADDFQIKIIDKNGNVQIEDPLIDFVICKHFEFISTHELSSTLGIPSTMNFEDYNGSYYDFITRKKKQMKTYLWYGRMKDLTLQLLGSFCGMALSFYISSALRKRIE